MKIIDVINAADGRICGSEAFLWGCYGSDAIYLNFSDINNQEVIGCIFDRKNQEVYELEVSIPQSDTHFKWFNPDTFEAIEQFSKNRQLDVWTAYDDVEYKQVSQEDQIIQYVRDVVATYYDAMLDGEETQ
jgi:hypothetical protein